MIQPRVQGNVEYKLKLLNPPPERFMRLVTQMKWRLLEGGGQAYYELGVADSGQLIGLPRKDLEESLETLEMMAGDIGASVIVVKEIEVPAGLVGSGMNSSLPQFTPVPAITERDIETSTTTETETSTTEDDDDPLTGLGLDTPPNTIAYHQTHFTTRSHPDRPASQSSPAIHPVDANGEHELDSDPMFHLDFEIEIASVYKPCPHRSRPATPPGQSKYTRRGTAPKSKKFQSQNRGASTADPVAKAAEKRMKRDARRDQRRRALLMPDIRMEDTSKTTTELRELHVGLDPTVRAIDAQPIVPALSNLAVRDLEADEDTVITDAPEPRLIVEALVVRKLTIEEAFLDFGGFALQI